MPISCVGVRTLAQLQEVVATSTGELAGYPTPSPSCLSASLLLAGLIVLRHCILNYLST